MTDRSQPSSPARGAADVPETDERVLKDRALDASAEGITIADARRPDHPLIYVNRAFENMTGYSAGEALGRNCRFLQGDGTDARSVAEIRDAVSEGRECVVELLNYRKDGTPFWNRLSITPIRDNDGAVTHFIGVQSDISDSKNAEYTLSAVNIALARANRRIKQNLDMAVRIQRGFLPPEEVEIDGIDVAWELRACDELAGDTLNVALLDDRHVEFYMVDVSGHGVAASLLSVTLNHLLSPASGQLILGPHPDAPAEGLIGPAEVAAMLARQFPYDEERNQYFTLVYGIYDRRKRLFHFVSAGHPPPILVSRSGEIRHDWSEGVPIGIVPDFPYQQNTIELAPGDRMYLYSDGLIDVFDPRRELYGLERLKAGLAARREVSVTESVRAIVDDVELWGAGKPFEDDLSILAFEAT